MNDLISIIIPVYNVEKYLRQCIDSVVDQTYKNLQIILVNDGSTDDCDKICQEYEKCDQRIQIIRQKNQGLSAARNTGLRYAKGSYVLFLDSDDYIEKTACEAFLCAAKETESDIVVGGIQTVDETGNIFHCNTELLPEKRIVLNSQTAMRELLTEQQMKGYAWGKLYKREIVDQIQFPVGKAFEDRFTLYKYFARAHKICICPGTCTYYRMRAGSIMHNTNLKKWYDLIEAEENLILYCQKEHPELLQEMETKFFGRLVHIWISFYDSGDREETRNLQNLMKQVYQQYKDKEYIKKVHKWSYILIFMIPGVYRQVIHFAHWDKKDLI